MMSDAAPASTTKWPPEAATAIMLTRAFTQSRPRLGLLDFGALRKSQR